MSCKWRRVDSCDNWTPAYLDLNNDLCIYARRYKSGGGWQHNQDIANLKKPPNSTPIELAYKDKAIKKFASEIATLILGNKPIYFAAIPSSKSTSDPDFDDRIERVLLALKNQKSNCIIESPISNNSTAQSTSKGGARTPKAILSNYKWQGFAGNPPEKLIIVDDVLTTGAHFKAYQSLVNQYHPNILIQGIFWAMTES